MFKKKTKISSNFTSFSFILSGFSAAKQRVKNLKLNNKKEVEEEEEKKKKSHSVLHGISGDDVGVVVVDICGDAVGEEAYADVPLDKEMAAVVVPPYPTDPHPRFAVFLLEVEAVDFVRHCLLNFDYFRVWLVRGGGDQI